MRKLIGYIAVAVMLSACFNEEAYDGEVVLRPYQQLSDGADFIPLNGVVAYSYAAPEKGDVDDITVESYEDALNGVVSVIETGEVLTPLATSSPYSSAGFDFDGAVSIPVERQYIYLVVADTENEDYAYGFYEMGVNIATSYISLAFRSWYANTVESGDWVYVVPVANTDEGYDDGTLTVPDLTE